MAKLDIYGNKKQWAYWVARINGTAEFSDEVKEELHGFFNYCSSRGLSTERMLVYVHRLYPLAKMLGKPFKQATKTDIEGIVAQIQQREDISDATKGIYRVTLKKFYKWLEGNDEFYPEKVRWIKSRAGSKKMLPEDLLTKEDVEKMMDASENSRDKALLAVLYESGCRIGEIASLQIKNISFDQYGATLIVSGKTGMRRVRIISSVHYLTIWLEQHPGKQNPDAYLWIKLTRHKGNPMDYSTIRTQVSKLADKADIKKRANLHGFRHSRATELAKMGLNEAQMSAHLGWVPSTKMAATYIHLSGADVDNALLSAYGIKTQDEQSMKPKCPRCFRVNDATLKFCGACGMPLNLRAAVEMENKNEQFKQKIEDVIDLLESYEVREFIASKLASKST